MLCGMVKRLRMENSPGMAGRTINTCNLTWKRRKIAYPRDMKRAILILTALLVSAAAHAQGTISFANTAATTVRINPATPIPAGSQFMVELMYAPDGTAPAEFNAIAVRLGAAVPFGPLPGL